MMFSKKSFVLSFLFFQCWSVLLSASESESPILCHSFDGIEGSVDSNGLSVTPVVCPTPEFDVPEENLAKSAVQNFPGKKLEGKALKADWTPLKRLNFTNFDQQLSKQKKNCNMSKAEQDCTYLVSNILDYSVLDFREEYLTACDDTVCEIEQLLKANKIGEDFECHDVDTNRRLRLNLIYACMTEEQLHDIVKKGDQTVIDLVCQKVKNRYLQELLKDEILQQPEQCKKIKDEENFWAVGLEKQSKLLRAVSLKQASIKKALYQAEKDEKGLRKDIDRTYNQATGKIVSPLQAWQRKELEDAETQARAIQQIELLSELHSDEQYHSQFFNINYKHRTAELTELKKRERNSCARILKVQKDKHELMQEQERDGLQAQEQSDRELVEQSLFDQFLTVHYEQKQELGTLVYLKSLQNLKNTEQQKLQQIVSAWYLKKFSELETTQTKERTKIEEEHSFLLVGSKLKEKELRVPCLQRQKLREQAEVARLKKESEAVRLAEESEEQQARAELVEQQVRSARYTSSIYKHQPYSGGVAPSDMVRESHDLGFNVVVRKRR